MDSTIAIESDYVLVSSRTVATPDAARELCQAIDKALLQNRVRAVLFDSRVTKTPPKDASSVVWEWTFESKNHDVVALIVNSELLKVSGNMTALSHGARMRSFGTKTEAQSFITRQLGITMKD